MDRRGWRQWTERDAREALAELARTGESLAEFARRRGVSGERVRYWVCHRRSTVWTAIEFYGWPATGWRRWVGRRQLGRAAHSSV